MILLDLAASGLDGCSVCRALKAGDRLRHIPVVFLTGPQTDRQSRKQALEAGAEAFLAKPLDESELVAMTRAMAKIKSASQAQAPGREFKPAPPSQCIYDSQKEPARREMPAEARAEVEDRYRMLFDQMDEGVTINEAVFDENGDVVDYIILDVNPAFERHSGYSADEALGHRATDVYQMSSEHMRDWWRAHSPLTQAAHMELYHEPSSTWKSITTTPMAGNRFLTLAKNITERKRTEEALRASEARFRAVVENSNDGILFTDADAKILYRSPSYGRINGFVDEERVGRSGFETVHPDDVDGLRRYWTKHLEHPDPSDKAEYRIRHKNGTWRWVESSFQYLLDNPDVRAIVVATRDITARKQSEEALRASELRFRTLIEQAPIAISISRNGIGLYANQRLLDIFGLHSEAEWIGPVADHFAPKYLEVSRERTQRLALGLPVPAQFESAFLREDGFQFPVQVAVARVQLADGMANITFVADLTEQKRAEAALRESQALTNAIVDSTSDMIWSVDPERFGLLTFNHGLSDYFLHRRGMTIQTGMRPEDLFPTDDFVRQWHSFYNRALAEGPYSTEYAVYAGTNWLELSLCPLRRDGEVFGIAVFGKDITERKRGEESLRESEARYRAIYDNAIEGMFRTSLEGKNLQSNRALAAMLGYDSPHDIVNAVKDSAHQVWVNADERARYTSLLEEQGAVREFECQFKRLDGTVIWVSLNARLVRDQDGNGLYGEGFIEDITERKQAEEELRESEARYRHIAENTADVIWTLSLKTGKFTYASPSVQKLLGYTPEEALTLTLADTLIPESAAMAEQAVQQRLAAFRASGAARSVINERYDQRCKDGTVVTTEVASTIVADEQGEPVEVVGVTRDVTERKRAEAERARLQAQLEAQARQIAQIMDAVPEGVLLLDADGHVLMANPSGAPAVWRSWPARTPASRSRSWASCPWPTCWALPIVDAPWRESGPARVPSRRSPGQSPMARVSPVDPQPSPRHWVLVVDDVTELRDQQRYRQLQDRLATVGQMAAGIAHDFNNITGTIVLYAGMLEKAPELSDRYRRYVATIHQQADHATRLIRQIPRLRAARAPGTYTSRLASAAKGAGQAAGTFPSGRYRLAGSLRPR